MEGKIQRNLNKKKIEKVEGKGKVENNRVGVPGQLGEKATNTKLPVDCTQ
jgi:hypothetical protein